MNLPVPGVGLTSGPQYATDIDNCLTIIDSHDHAAGSGVQITPAGININSPLAMNSNDLTFANSLAMISQLAAFTPGANVRSLYVVGNELFYQDGAGANVQITLSGSVTGSSGTITGLPSGTASASFASSTFTFQSATTVAANLDFRSAILRNSTASSFGLTLQAPTLGSDYTITLPQLPATTSFVSISSSGTMGSAVSQTGGITSSMIASATIVSGNIAANTILGNNIALNTVSGNNIVDNVNLNGLAAAQSKYLVSVNTNPGAGTLSIVRGTISVGGTILAGEGFSVSTPGTGRYQIDFDTPFHDGPAISANIIGVPVGYIVANAAPTGSGVEMRTFNTSEVLTNKSFMFIAIGVRA